jgi:diguanylate cyclase
MFVANTLAALPDSASRQRFVDRVYRLRTVGLGLGSLAVGSALYQNDAPLAFWILLIADGLLWPHIAHRIASGGSDPSRRELRNLLFDSASGGFWVAVMQFNLLPSVLLLTMLALDKISVGGWALLGRALGLQVCVCVLTALVLFAIDGTFPFRLESTMLNVVGSLPFLVVYPLVISSANYTLATRVRRQNRELERLNTVDLATGLLNRVSWHEAVGRELRYLKRYAHSASLLMIDIDYFKEINDRFGHPIGDSVIAAVAATIKDCTREIDVAGRYGGDEFCVLLTHTGELAATVAAERIRARVGAALIANAPGLHCTLSIGIATAGPDTTNAAAWIARADMALYRAKTLGRNQAVHAGDDALEMPSTPVNRPFTES